jgi:peptidoglycan/xylan/chitin deacetylase (PgdA/CDA1 family)
VRLLKLVRGSVRALVVVVLFALVPTASAAQTVVSLEFDDGYADQFQTKDMLAAHGMNGTFFIISGAWGASQYMTPEQVKALSDAGNEIGGHTVDHPDLTTLTHDDQLREICNDRVALSNLGIEVSDLAYPYGSTNADVKSAVQACGYNSARGVGGIKSPTDCTFCPTAETIPPADPFKTLTPDGVVEGNTLQQLEDLVTQAELNGGGWVQIVMHHVCDACGETYAISPTTLGAFLDWLQPRSSAGTVVKTVHEVIGGATQPVVHGPPPVAPGPGPNVVLNPSLEQDANHDQLPDCFQFSGYGTNDFLFTRTSDPNEVHSGSFAERLDINAITDGDRKLLTLEDTGDCAPKPTPGHSYDASVWYKSTTPSGLVAFIRDSGGNWGFWAAGPATPVSPDDWAQTTWTTPPIPAGTTGISFGLAISSVGTLITDDYSLIDHDQTPPDVDLVQPGGEATVHGTTSLVASASDESGIDHVDFLVNGNVIGTDNAEPYTQAWDSTQVADGTVNVQARAVDTAGNVATTAARQILVDNTAPTSAIACNGTTCRTGPYSGSVSVTLSGADAGSGLGSIRYSTDGSDPDPLTGLRYTGPFTVSSTTTVKFRAIDNAGNAEGVNGQTIQITGPPGVTLTAPADGAWTNGATMLAADANSAVGIDHVDFQIDGSTVGSDSSAPYSVSWNAATVTDGSHTVKAVAVDTDGNSTSSDTRTVKVDKVAPVTSIQCAAATCASTPYGAGVQVTLSANAGTGSPIAAIRYTTDGSEPTTTNGATYTGPFSLSTTTQVRFRSYDVAGNVEATRSQLVNVDTTAPTSAIFCNGTACSGSAYHSTVSVSLSASDGTGGSGVAAIRYTTNGTDPTTTNGITYSAPFNVSSTTTVKFRAYDRVGNAGVIHAQTITITPPDTIAPTSSIRCNGASCVPGWYGAGLQVTLSATDNAGGSGVAVIRYTTNGTIPTLTNGSTYTGPLSFTSTTTIRWRAYDVAGNAENTHVQSIQVDSQLPTISGRCGSTSCSTGWYSSSQTISLFGNDNGGSGLSQMRYTTDGSDPTPTHGVQYHAAFVVSSPTTVKARAYDGAGNASALLTLQVKVDTVDPNVQITSPGNGSILRRPATVNINASATDSLSGIANVQFYIDGVLKATDSSAPFTYAWSTTSSGPGFHVITVAATDNAGNRDTQSIWVLVL